MIQENLLLSKSKKIHSLPVYNMFFYIYNLIKLKFQVALYLIDVFSCGNRTIQWYHDINLKENT